MTKRFFLCVLLIASRHLCLHAQENDSLFSRLQALSNNGVDFYNVDGIEITCQHINAEFTKRNIQKKFKKYSIWEENLEVSDSTLKSPNYYVSKSEEIIPGTVEYNSYYFVENASKGITAVTFTGANKGDRVFERKFVDLLLHNKIPPSVFAASQIDTILFCGRKIDLGPACRWMGVNNVQCTYYGQMNWSMHKTLAGAAESVHHQYNIIKARKGGKIISEDSVDVIFEGTPVKAKRAIYDITGVKSIIIGMGGGKTLTIYFVSAPVRQSFVSCVMSFWNHDRINPNTGLPALPEEVMKLVK